MDMLKYEIVERISKIIVLKDMTIVRYKNQLNKFIFRIYFNNGGTCVAGTYSNLLDIISIHRLFN